MTRYYRPTSRSAALEVLADAHGTGRPLVGGTDVLVALRHHKIDPTVLVDLKGITDLPDPLQVTPTSVRIGPTMTMAALAGDSTIRSWYPALVESALTVGSVAIRNRATLVGNLCNASPAADTVGSLLVHDAAVTISSVDGDRVVTLDDFLLGPRDTLCGPGEIVSLVELARPAPGSSSAFQRLTRRRGVDLATVSVAAAVDSSATVTFGLGAVGPRVLRTELALGPDGLDDDRGLTAAIDQHLAVATPISDIRGSREYRLATVRVLAKRAILSAAHRRYDTKEAS